jgi:hypothetical protein
MTSALVNMRLSLAPQRVERSMGNTSYYFDTKLGAHVVEHVDTSDDGRCDKALFYGPDARAMAYVFARTYYGSSVAALTAEEQSKIAEALNA